MSPSEIAESLAKLVTRASDQEVRAILLKVKHTNNFAANGKLLTSFKSRKLLKALFFLGGLEENSNNKFKNLLYEVIITSYVEIIYLPQHRSSQITFLVQKLKSLVTIYNLKTHLCENFLQP